MLENALLCRQNARLKNRFIMLEIMLAEFIQASLLALHVFMCTENRLGTKEFPAKCPWSPWSLVVMIQNGGRSAPTSKKAKKDRENKLTSERGGWQTTAVDKPNRWD